MKKNKSWKGFFISGFIIILIGTIIMLISQLLSKKISLLCFSILISIGTSLVASGLVILIDIIREILKNNVIYRINNIINKAGVTDVFFKRDLDLYDNLMKNIKNELKITGYSLRSFFDSYEYILKSKKNINIQILVVDPDSTYAKNREILEGDKPGTFKNSIQKIKKRLTKTNIKIHKIDMPLTTMIFKIDDVMFIGPHLLSKASKATNTIQLEKGGKLYNEYDNEFNSLWEKSSPI